MKPGANVAWQWGSGIAEGVIESIHPEPTTIISKGKRIKRNGSPSNPAIFKSCVLEWFELLRSELCIFMQNCGYGGEHEMAFEPSGKFL